MWYVIVGVSAAIDVDEREKRRASALALTFAGVGSLLLHAALLWSFAGGASAVTEGASEAAVAFVDFAVPGAGPPGAPSGGATANVAPEARVLEDDDAPVVAAQPRAARRGPAPIAALTSEAGTDLAAVSDASEVAESGTLGATDEGEADSSDAFLDGLMARSTERGVPGARGGDGCPDPIAGTWRARRYDEARERWGVFTLRIAREGATLEGRIRLHAWSGPRAGRTPPRCAPGVYEHSVRMPASGSFDGERFRFDASSYERVTHCMDARFDYNLDHFTGRVEGDVLHVVNNDGGHEVNAPYRFRRLSCQ